MNFSHIVTSFFNAYLTAERGLSVNTRASYSDVMRLLLNFACERFHVEPEKLNLEQLSRDLIVDFLDHLEKVRENAAETRNQRLAAIKTFCHFLARNVPELQHLNATVQAIREKQTAQEPPPSLSVTEVEAIMAVPDTSRLLGARDNALVLLLYNSGARVQEVADLKLAHLHADESSALVTLTGKGRKTRVIPLWPKTLLAIRHYLTMRQHHGIQSDHLFINVKAQPMTRFGIGRRIDLLAREAASTCSSLCDRTVTPHVLRHTTALHLIESGNDIAVVKDWLGHADLKTTSTYLEVSIRRKRNALAKLSPPDGSEPVEQPQWKQPRLMTFLAKLSRGVMLPTLRSLPQSPLSATT